MLNHAALEVLELTPLWQSRLPRSRSKPVWQVRVVVTRDQRTGWVVLEQPLQGDAAVLFDNVLAALKLQWVQDWTTERDTLAAQVQQQLPAWLWLTDAAQRETFSAADSASQAACPILFSPPPEQLLTDAAAKAQLWADWCRVILKPA